MVLLWIPKNPAMAQDIALRNASFEDTPRRGSINTYGFYTRSVDEWFDCGRIYFPNETPPDIHPNDYWRNTTPPSDGATYLGMVVRDNESWESVSQRLSLPFRSDRCYTFTIDLCRSDDYWSATKTGNMEVANYVTAAVLRIWGGSEFCSRGELLGESLPVVNSEWQSYEFNIEPSDEYTYVTLEAFYKTPVLFSYNGHILLDNCSGFREIDCETNEPLYVEVEKPEPRERETRTSPQVKPKDRNQEVFEPGEVEKNVDTLVYVRPKKKEKEKIIVDLDRSKIRTGQTIQINKLYFEADTSTINPGSYEVLDEVYDFLAENKDIFVEIGGHTNGVPAHSYCDKLSEDRARRVAEYLIDKGIETERIQYKGYGKRKPIASNRTKLGRKKNQRVEIKIMRMG